MPFAFYEGIQDGVMGNTDVRNESFSSSEQVPDEISVLPSCSTTNTNISPGCILGRRFIERLTADECKEEIQKTMAAIAGHIDKNSENLNLLRGFIKFCKRAQ